MIVGGAPNPVLLAASPDPLDEYGVIEKSIRLRSATSAYLSRTPSVEGNRKTWTWSGWVKRSKLNTEQMIFCVNGDTSNHCFIEFQPDNTLRFASNEGGTNYIDLRTTAVFRDVSAWMHIVVAVDCENVTQSLRARIFVNGEECALSVATLPTSTTHSTTVSKAVEHYLSRYGNTVSHFLEGYLSDVCLVDGQALTPDAFGAEHPVTKQWRPKTYTGSYGTNGFHLDFADNSSAAALGYDVSADNPRILIDSNPSSLSGWTVTAGGGSPYFNLTNGKGRLGNSSSYATYAAQAFSTEVGKTYYVSTNISNLNLGASGRVARVTKSDDAFTDVNRVDIGSVAQPSSGTVRGSFVATATTTYLRFTSDVYSSGYADFDAIRVTEGGYNNDWEVVNITTADQTIDTPTNNFCTLNPLAKGSDATLSNGNLDIAYGSGASISCTTATMGMSSGVWEWKFTLTAMSSTNVMIGIANTPNPVELPNYPGFNEKGWSYYGNGTTYHNETIAAYGDPITVGDEVVVRFDADNGELSFKLNDVDQGIAFSGLPAGTYFPAWGDGSQTNTWSGTVDFGQLGFTPSSGAKKLCTKNLPMPEGAALKPYEHFDVLLYSGDGYNNPKSVIGAQFQPDLVWLKCRTTASYGHRLVDSVRGSTKALKSHVTDAEETISSGVTSFDVSGFSVGAGATDYNASAHTYASWLWKAGGATVTNNDGSISSQVSANPEAGFSIVSFTSTITTSGTHTIGHGLRKKPDLMIFKSRNAAHSWGVYHSSLGASSILYLNTTDTKNTSAFHLNNTEPDASVFTVAYGTATGYAADRIAYCFSEIEGYSKIGAYIGNGLADGAFIDCGGDVEYLLIKSVTTAQEWIVIDSARSPYNVANDLILPSNSAAEISDGPNYVDFVSNGFKVRGTGGSTNTSGASYIYYAILKQPFRYSNAR